MKAILFIMAMALSANILIADPSANMLIDASFEKGFMDGPFSTNWTVFGQAHCEAKDPRSGIFAVKLYGNYKGEPNWSGIYQNCPAQSDRFYEATGYFKQISSDHLKGDNTGWLKLEFYNREGKQLAAYSSIKRFDTKSPSNRFVFLSTGRVSSPPETVTARIVVIFEQGADNAHGAVWVDDLSVREIP